MAYKNAPFRGRTLVDSAARTATGNSGWLDFPVDFCGGSFYLDCTAVAGSSPTLDVAISTTPDNETTEIFKFRFAQLTTAADREMQTFFSPTQTSDTDIHTERAGLAATGGALSLPSPIADKIKITWTIGGTSPSFTFKVTFIPWRKISGGY